MLSQAGDTLPCTAASGVFMRAAARHCTPCMHAATAKCRAVTLPYFKMTGCTGSPARKAPVLNGSR